MRYLKMDIIKFFDENIWLRRTVYSVIAVIVTVTLYELFTRLVLARLSEGNKGKKYNTYIRLFKSVTRYVFIIALLFAILKINGVNITSVVTGVGVMGIVFGFALQDSLKDIIKGLDIITDSYYHVGDVIKVGGHTGIVLAIGLKTTRLKDIYGNNIVSISTRTIEEAEVLSHLFCIEIPLPYELKLEDADSVMRDITDRIKKIGGVENAEYGGANELADSSIKYLIKVFCPPAERLGTRRNAISCALKCLEERNISIPFNQLDIHQK